jgi:hypothetical protein
MVAVSTPAAADASTPMMGNAEASIEDAFQMLCTQPSCVNDMAVAAMDDREITAKPNPPAYNDTTLREYMDMSLADWNTIFVNGTE